MSGKFMITKKIILPVMAAIILVSQLTGCAAVSSKEMVSMIDQGQTIVLEVNQPSTYKINIQGEQKQDVTWVQLDQLKTFNMGFRQGVDELFNVNTITDASQGTVGGKQGCLFVVNVDGQEMRSGNTTIEDALRNKTFMTKYWNNIEIQSKIAELCEQAYTDVDRNSPYAVEATLNAYFNLLNDAENPDSFNPTQSVSREEFYTMLFKSTDGVRDLGYYPSTDSFTSAVGGDTEYTMYAKQVADFGFLSVENKSLDSSNIGTSISRAEAVYMLVQQNFPELFEQATDKSQGFSDTKSAGDLALKVGFKEEVTKERTNSETGKTEKYKEVIEKDRWQAYTLAYMFKNPDKGLQSELYRAMVVAKQVGIIDENESRWDETLSKSEAIDLIIATQIAKNNQFGYLTESEYATIEAPANYNDNVDGKYIVSTPDELEHNDIISEYTLDMLSEEQLGIFEMVVGEYPQQIKDGIFTVEQADEIQNDMLTSIIIEGGLPENGISLFGEWKASINYYDQFKDIQQSVVDKENTVNNEQSTGTQSQPTESQQSKPTGNTNTKPQPAPSQQQQQQESVSGPSENEIYKPTPEQQIQDQKDAGFDKPGSIVTDWDF